ncbi:MAG: F0F1 ATP synthase subunit delta [Pseudomonadota bacterium]
MELVTLARPYAKAAFEFARENDHLKEWSRALLNASLIASDGDMQKLFNHPSLLPEQILDVFLDVLKKSKDSKFSNFLRMLAEYQRFDALPEIYKGFEALHSEHQKLKWVDVTSAYELTDSEKAELTLALEKRLKYKVELNCQVDSSILGGAIIRAGDLVIDGSGRAQLVRLTKFLEGTAL